MVREKKPIVDGRKLPEAELVLARWEAQAVALANLKVPAVQLLRLEPIAAALLQVSKMAHLS